MGNEEGGFRVRDAFCYRGWVMRGRWRGWKWSAIGMVTWRLFG